MTFTTGRSSTWADAVMSYVDCSVPFTSATTTVPVCVPETCWVGRRKIWEIVRNVSSWTSSISTSASMPLLATATASPFASSSGPATITRTSPVRQRIDGTPYRTWKRSGERGRPSTIARAGAME
jgi:hypothetical protein